MLLYWIDPIWRDEAETIRLVEEHLCNYDAIGAYQESLWHFYFSNHYDKNPISIIHRPSDDGALRKINYVYMDDVKTMHGTAGYDDVKEILTVIIYWLVFVHVFSCIIVYGDQ